MGEVDRSGDDVDASNPELVQNQARVVIDFTVGPAGVGPPTSITPAAMGDAHAEPPPAEQSDHRAELIQHAHLTVAPWRAIDEPSLDE